MGPALPDGASVARWGVMIANSQSKSIENGEKDNPKYNQRPHFLSLSLGHVVVDDATTGAIGPWAHWR